MPTPCRLDRADHAGLPLHGRRHLASAEALGEPRQPLFQAALRLSGETR